MDVTDIHNLLIDMLIAERKRAGLTQGQLARRLERPQSLLSRIEGGERKLELAEFLVIAAAIGFDPIVAVRRIQKALQRPRRPVLGPPGPR